MRAPVLAVGDGALGFWNGLREVFPETREGRCWFHKTANVLAALPKSAHPGAKKALAEIWGAEDKEHARAAIKAFDAAYGAKFPKATAKITDDADELLAFYDYPECAARGRDRQVVQRRSFPEAPDSERTHISLLTAHVRRADQTRGQLMTSGNSAPAPAAGSR